MSKKTIKIVSSYAFIVTEHLIQTMHCTSIKGLTTTCPMGVVIVTEGFSFPIKSKPYESPHTEKSVQMLAL